MVLLPTPEGPMKMTGLMALESIFYVVVVAAVLAGKVVNEMGERVTAATDVVLQFLF